MYVAPLLLVLKPATVLTIKPDETGSTKSAAPSLLSGVAPEGIGMGRFQQQFHEPNRTNTNKRFQPLSEARTERLL